VEHLCQYRGGICFCVDPTRAGWSSWIRQAAWTELEVYKAHIVEQAIPGLIAGHDIPCLFTTPKLLESLPKNWRTGEPGTRERASPASSRAATEFTRNTQGRHGRVAGQGIYMTPTFGNTLMGLACSKPVRAEEGYKITYYAPQPRAVIEVVPFDDYDRVVRTGKPDACRLTTLTKKLSSLAFWNERRRRARAPVRTISLDGVSA